MSTDTNFTIIGDDPQELSKEQLDQIQINQLMEKLNDTQLILSQTRMENQKYQQQITQQVNEHTNCQRKCQDLEDIAMLDQIEIERLHRQLQTDLTTHQTETEHAKQVKNQEIDQLKSDLNHKMLQICDESRTEVETTLKLRTEPLNRQNQQLIMDNQNLQTTMINRESYYMQMHDKFQTLQSHDEELSKNYKELSKNYDQLNKNYDQLTQTSQKVQLRLDDTEFDNAIIKKKYNQLTETNANLTIQIQQLKDEHLRTDKHKQLCAEKQALQHQCNKYAEANFNLVTQINQLELKQTAFEKQAQKISDQFRVDKQQSQARIYHLQDEIDDKQSDNEVLREIISNLQFDLNNSR